MASTTANDIKSIFFTVYPPLKILQNCITSFSL
jgi:hypothetical protein